MEGGNKEEAQGWVKAVAVAVAVGGFGKGVEEGQEGQ